MRYPALDGVLNVNVAGKKSTLQSDWLMLGLLMIQRQLPYKLLIKFSILMHHCVDVEVKGVLLRVCFVNYSDFVA